MNKKLSAYFAQHMIYSILLENPNKWKSIFLKFCFEFYLDRYGYLRKWIGTKKNIYWRRKQRIHFMQKVVQTIGFTNKKQCDLAGKIQPGIPVLFWK